MGEDRSSREDPFNGFIIIEPIIINNVIERLYKNRSTLSVNVPSRKLSCISLITAIDDDYQYLEIDELKSNAPIKQNIGKETLSLESKLDNLPVTFNSHFIRYKGPNKFSYKIKYPHSIEYPQRRQSHRVTIARELNATAFIRDAGEWFEIGRVCDLSESGLCITTRKNLQQIQLLSEEGSQAFKLIFQNDESIECTTIRANIISEKNDTVRFGATFKDLQEPNKSKLLKILMQHERDNVRKGLGS